MPILPFMDFAEHDLVVRYRASPDPQKLVLDVTTSGVAGNETFPSILQTIKRLVDRGGGASDRFEPWNCSATVTAKPARHERRGPNYHAEMQVAGMAPEFLRVFVERLRGSGFEQPVTSVSIHGELPLDRSAFSVTEREVKQWLDDPGAYPKAWPDPGFPLTERDNTKGVAVRLTLNGPLSPALTEQLQAIFIGWGTVAQSFVGPDGKFVSPNSYSRLIWKFATSKHELIARAEVWPWTHEPTKNLLKNELCSFHHATAPFLSVDIAL